MNQGMIIAKFNYHQIKVGHISTKSLFLSVCKTNYFCRELSGQEITDLFMNMYIETPVQDWGHILNETDFPDLRITMCGYFSLALTMTFNESVVDTLTDILANAFSYELFVYMKYSGVSYIAVKITFE